MPANATQTLDLNNMWTETSWADQYPCADLDAAKEGRKAFPSGARRAMASGWSSEVEVAGAGGGGAAEGAL